MTSVLVTGGAGYIGSVLVAKLLNKKYKVIVLDNFLYKQTSLAHLISNKDLSLVFGDVRNHELVSSLIRKVDVVIPLAAIVGAPACAKDPIMATSINKTSTSWLIDQITDTQQIIMPTTNSAYGSGNEQNLCDEKSSLNPISQYAKEKVFIENLLMEKDNVTSFRLATVFGISPRMRLDLLVNNFVYRAVTDRYVTLFEGHFKRNYVHVDDVANAFLFAVENPSLVKNQIFNFGLSEANISKQQLCERIKNQLPDFTFQDAPLAKDPDQRNYIVSNKKIEAIGMKAKVTLDEGISELIKGLGMFTSNRYTNL
jgi:nucleoside-diphosphate-sugar epimerase